MIKYKAVIVDDDIKIIILVEKALTELGFVVYSATEGKKALELVQDEKPDLLVSDILQPGLDGVRLCNLIKKDPQLSHTKIFLVTGVYNRTSFKLQMDCEPDAFIEKPVDMTQFQETVKRLILE